MDIMVDKKIGIIFFRKIEIFFKSNPDPIINIIIFVKIPMWFIVEVKNPKELNTSAVISLCATTIVNSEIKLARLFTMKIVDRYPTDNEILFCDIFQFQNFINYTRF